MLYFRHSKSRSSNRRYQSGLLARRPRQQRYGHGHLPDFDSKASLLVEARVHACLQLDMFNETSHLLSRPTSLRGVSILIHGVVAVLWCVDFGMSAMPLRAVHCFSCVLTLSAFISTSFFVPNMKQDPPYPFLDPRLPLGGAFVFAAYGSVLCVCYALLATNYCMR